MLYLLIRLNLVRLLVCPLALEIIIYYLSFHGACIFRLYHCKLSWYSCFTYLRPCLMYDITEHSNRTLQLICGQCTCYCDLIWHDSSLTGVMSFPYIFYYIRDYNKRMYHLFVVVSGVFYLTFTVGSDIMLMSMDLLQMFTIF